MYLSQFLLGIVIGVSASIPLGPVGVLCVQRTLNNDFKTGFVSGLGAATADTIFAVVAMFFVTMVTSFIDEHMSLCSAVGGLILAYVGMHIYRTRKKVVVRRNRNGKRRMYRDYLSILVITLTNPAFIVVFMTLFASFGVENNGGIVSPLLTILGVATGCSIWWFVLTFTVNLLRRKFRPRHLLYINMVAGAVIFALGTIAVLTTIYNLIF